MLHLQSIGGVEVIMGTGDDVAELDLGKTAPKPDKAVTPRQHIVRRGTIIDLAFRGESLTPREHASAAGPAGFCCSGHAA